MKLNQILGISPLINAFSNCVLIDLAFPKAMLILQLIHVPQK